MSKNKPEDVFRSIDMRGGDVDACWPWTASLNKSDGRPYFTAEGKKKAAYVVVLELFTGEPSAGRFALHSCDNEVCCNPHHLHWGDHQENMDEMKQRERHGMPRNVVKAWSKLRSAGQTYLQIATLYGVSDEAVRLQLNQLPEKEQDNGREAEREDQSTVRPGHEHEGSEGNDE